MNPLALLRSPLWRAPFVLGVLSAFGGLRVVVPHALS